MASLEFTIEVLANAYRIHNFSFNGKLYVVDMKKQLSSNADAQDPWKVPPLSFSYKLMEMLYLHQDDIQAGIVEKLRRIFAKDMNAGLATSTIVTGRTCRKKWIIVTHWYGYAEMDTKNVLHHTSHFEENIERALFGTENLRQVEMVYRWISGKDNWYRLPCPLFWGAAFRRAVELSDNFYKYSVPNVSRPSRSILLNQMP